jgi:hypothetical protein
MCGFDFDESVGHENFYTPRSFLSVSVGHLYHTFQKSWSVYVYNYTPLGLSCPVLQSSSVISHPGWFLKMFIMNR